MYESIVLMKVIPTDIEYFSDDHILGAQLMKLTSALLAGALALGTASTANASIVLTPGSGWQTFSFGGAGSSFSDTISFTIAGTSLFKITDAYLDGDQFKISPNGGLFYIFTSVPVNDSTDLGGDFDAAFASPKFSSLSLLLGAGTYTLIGKVLVSPYGGGGGAVELTAAPEPAAWALMIAGFGAAGGALRRRIKASKVTYKLA